MSDASFTYIIANPPNGPLHVGTTDDIVRCLHEHRNGERSEIAEEAEIPSLVHFEHFDRREEALHRSEQLKAWPRNRKVDLIQEHNPRWRDLYVEALRTYGTDADDSTAPWTVRARRAERLPRET